MTVHLENAATCRCRKAAYTSKAKAKQVVRRMIGQGVTERAARLHAYRCPDDEGLWHVGHRPGAVTRGEVPRRDVPTRRAGWSRA